MTATPDRHPEAFEPDPHSSGSLLYWALTLINTVGVDDAPGIAWLHEVERLKHEFNQLAERQHAENFAEDWAVARLEMALGFTQLNEPDEVFATVRIPAPDPDAYSHREPTETMDIFLDDIRTVTKVARRHLDAQPVVDETMAPVDETDG